MSSPRTAPALARPHQAEHGLDQRGLAHAVAPHEADGLALAHGEIDAVQDVADAVEGVQAAALRATDQSWSISSPPR
jgi:hypothetical protein